MNFVALDVETANSDLSSLCQIGVVVFEDGKPSTQWESLVNPEAPFDRNNISVHGIDGARVRKAPVFSAVYERLAEFLTNRIVAHHMPFDRLAIARVKQKYGHPPIDCRWLDTAKVVRSAWPEFSARGYGLKNMASHLGITFRHHSAVEDARAAGEILVHAIQRSGIAVEQWPTHGMAPLRKPRKAIPDPARPGS